MAEETQNVLVEKLEGSAREYYTIPTTSSGRQGEGLSNGGQSPMGKEFLEEEEN